MPKLRRTNTVTNYVIKPRIKAVDKRLEKKQKLDDKLDRLMEEFDVLNFQKNNEYFGLEDIKEQENYLKKLALETTISKESKNRPLSPAIKRARIRRQIVTLKNKMDFLKNALNQQKTNLLKIMQNKDHKNLEFTKRFILKLEKDIKEINTKYQALKKLLKYFNNQSKSLVKR